MVKFSHRQLGLKTLSAFLTDGEIHFSKSHRYTESELEATFPDVQVGGHWSPSRCRHKQENCCCHTIQASHSQYVMTTNKKIKEYLNLSFIHSFKLGTQLVIDTKT